MAATTRRNFNLEELIVMLRAKCPIFDGRIGALSVFTNLTAPSLNLTVPYCVITRIGNYGEPYNKSTGSQLRNGMISFLVCVDNSKQLGSGAGKEAVRAIDSLEIPFAQIEQALLEWSPVNIDLADTPLYTDDGFIGSDNAKLWHEMVWQIPYIVRNPAFMGLGHNPDPDDETNYPFDLTQLAIHYGTTPVSLFLDEWIYGPQISPPQPTDEEIDEANESAALYNANLEVIQDKQPNPPDQDRGMQVITVIDP